MGPGPAVAGTMCGTILDQLRVRGDITCDISPGVCTACGLDPILGGRGAVCNVDPIVGAAGTGSNMGVGKVGGGGEGP